MPLLPTPMDEKKARMKNPLALAYIGDTVWDMLVRQRLLMSDKHVAELHKLAIRQVNAGAQSAASALIRDELTETESDIFRRGCNAHARHATPKNQDPYDYNCATGLEALMGYLYLTGQNERILELFDRTLPKE